MKECPDAPETQPDNPVDARPAQPPSGSAPYREMYLYVLLFVSFTTGAAISVIVNELSTATGSPADTARSILQDLRRAAGAGAVFAVTVALIFKTTRLVTRSWRKLPFKPQQQKRHK